MCNGATVSIMHNSIVCYGNDTLIFSIRFVATLLLPHPLLQTSEFAISPTNCNSLPFSSPLALYKGHNKVTELYSDWHCLWCNISQNLAVSRYTKGGTGGRGITPTHSRPRHYTGDEWLASRSGRALPTGKGSPVPIGQEAGWAPEPVWTQEVRGKILCFCRGSNLHRPVVQPVARHYIDWATPAPLWILSK
jgi:hypothetical protein